MTILNGYPVSQQVWHAKKTGTLLNGHECRALVNHRQWWRLHVSEKFSSGNIKSIQTNQSTASHMGKMAKGWRKCNLSEHFWGNLFSYWSITAFWIFTWSEKRLPGFALHTLQGLTRPQAAHLTCVLPMVISGHSVAQCNTSIVLNPAKMYDPLPP